MGLGLCMPREAWREPPPNLFKRSLPTPRPADDDDAQTAGELSTTSTSAGAKVQGINMMKEKFLDSYNGYHLGLPMDPMEPPSLSLPLGDDHSDDDAICEPPQPGRGCRREEFVALGLEETRNNFLKLNFLLPH